MDIEERFQKMKWIPFFALLRRETLRFAKVIYQTIATPLVSICLYLLIFGMGMGRSIAPIQGNIYLAFLTPGLVMMTIFRNAFENSTGSIVIARYCGELEELRVSPFSEKQIIWAVSLAGLMRGLLVGMITFLLGSLFFALIEGEMLPLKHPFAFVFFSVIGGLAFANFGLITAMLAKNFEQVSGVQTFILFPLIYLGGVFFSVEELPDFWRQFSLFNPFLYLINGIRYGVLGISDVPIERAYVVGIVVFFFFYYGAFWGLKHSSYKRW